MTQNNSNNISLTKEIRYFKILEYLVKAGPKGISHQNLADKLKIDRDSLRRYMPDLLKTGVVRRHGKKGNYFISKVITSNDFLRGVILHKNFITQILGKDDIILFQMFMAYYPYPKKRGKKLRGDEKSEDEQENEYGNFFDAKDFYLKYFTPLFDKNSELEKKLFEFINQIGAYIVYILILTINRKKEINSLNKNDIDWLDGALNRFSSQIYRNFVNKFINIPPNEEQIKNIDKHIIENNLQKDDLSEKKIMLDIGFNNIYPYLSSKLNKLIEDSQEEVKVYDKNTVKKRLLKF